MKKNNGDMELYFKRFVKKNKGALDSLECSKWFFYEDFKFFKTINEKNKYYSFSYKNIQIRVFNFEDPKIFELEFCFKDIKNISEIQLFCENYKKCFSYIQKKINSIDVIKNENV